MYQPNKILIIPSWYATKDTPGRATFFREQALLFQDDFDVRIIAGVLNSRLNRISKIWNSIRFFFFNKVRVSKKENYFLEPPEVEGFAYEKGLNRFEKLNFNIMIRSWVRYLEKEILPIWKPDLIHAQNTFIAGIVARRISEKYDIPYIITDHHHLNPHYDKYINEEIKHALKNSVKNCFVSEWQYRTYLLLDPELKGTVVNNLLNDDVFIIEQKKKPGKFTILHVSNGFYPKDITSLAESFNLLFEKEKSIEKFRLLIIGMSEKVIEKLFSLIRYQEVIETIEVIHQLHHYELVPYYQQSDVFVFSSTHESFGIAPLEAMLCGVPVVTTSNGGIDEYLIQGVNCIKVPIKDAEGIAQALWDIYNQKIIFNATEVRNSVVDKFNKRSFKKRMLDIYNDCLIR